MFNAVIAKLKNMLKLNERMNERNFDMFAECIKKPKTVPNTPSIANIFNLLRIYRFLIS